MTAPEQQEPSASGSAVSGPVLVVVENASAAEGAPGPLAEGLAGSGRGTIIVAPPVVDLADDDLLWERIRRHPGRVIVVTAFHERAVRALFARRWNAGALPGPDRLQVVSLAGGAPGTNPGEIAARVEALMESDGPAGESADSAAEGLRVHRPAGGAARRWYPVIDVDRCVRCGQCYEFCIFGVYEREAAGGGVRVVRPDACKPGCPACARVCPVQAIIFPRCQDDPVIAGADPEAVEGAGPPRMESVEPSAGASAGAGTGACPRAAESLDDLIRRLDELDV